MIVPRRGSLPQMDGGPEGCLDGTPEGAEECSIGPGPNVLHGATSTRSPLLIRRCRWAAAASSSRWEMMR